MRPEKKSTRNETLTHHKINSVYINFHGGRNEVNFCFKGGPRKTTRSVKANRFSSDETDACADVYFHMVSFRVVFT